MFARSRFIAFSTCLVLVILGGLVACGSDKTSPSPTAPADSPTPAALSDTPVATATNAAVATATSALSATATQVASTATSAPPQPAATQPAAGASTAVTIVDFAFVPETLTAAAGQPVTIKINNNGNVQHTFTIDGVADSGTLDPGGSTTLMFTPAQAGTLTFYCVIHGATVMSGTITVQ